MEQRKKRGISRKAMLAGVTGVSALALTGCDVTPPDNGFFHALRMGWPEGVTPESYEIGNFWVWVWVAAWIIGIIMWGLMLYSIFGFSAKRAKKAGKDEFPRQTQYNIPLELVLTGVPIIIVMALFFFTVQTQDRVTALDKDPKVTVDVTAYQWNWKFGYQEVDGQFTPTGNQYQGIDEKRQAAAEESAEDPEGVKNANPIHGKSLNDRSYLHYNKIETVGTTEEVPVLVLPTNTAISFQLASADVSHSFWVPEFLFKRDVYSHPEANKSQREFQITSIDKEGAFVGRCAEMCGTYHAMMNFEVRAVSPEKFKQYLEYRMNNPQATNAAALESIGEAPYATSTAPFVSGREDSRDGGNFLDKPGANAGN
ncbi:Cytochrome c oxidase subunit 2 precursor [Corynebacterium ciconiae DSM 44920]|uniref:aa3-type cytochrome oxidase subunit II n=1 Tax=Corynebacterium ciconiae TaxID=227319 RepID=UPI0003778A87|nr:cytochrome c oxidase subunit II [Corynebacterium ciconiae]WKD60754.1 Cytochrome c oxidase subunit 2 precursor [Corynebacterium ciconiae DSM 44920]